MWRGGARRRVRARGLPAGLGWAQLVGELMRAPQTDAATAFGQAGAGRREAAAVLASMATGASSTTRLARTPLAVTRTKSSHWTWQQQH